ncbi:MAG: ABC transporter permease [Spirochaetes bacterium]|nr:ABC transporter permease [Spirochaetota bacterium]
MKKYLHEIIKRKDLIFTLVVSGLKAQHTNTFLGYFWWILDPMLGVVVYYFLRVVLLGAAGENIAIFLAVGLVSWRWLASVTNGSTKSISKESSLISKVYLPKAIFPLCLNLTQVINFAFGLFVITVFLLIFRVKPTLKLFWLPYIMIVQLIFMFALSLIFAYIGAFIKDIENVMSHIMRFWFYGSPVIWESDRVPAQYQWVVQLNPASALIGSYRNVFMYNQSPQFLKLNIILGVSLMVAIFMLFYYSRHEHKIIKAL